MIVVAAGVVWRDERLLLTRRMKGSHLAGLWEFPGGKLEPKEPPERAVVRECKEECGIDVRVIDVIDVTFHSYPERDVLLVFYDCAHIAGEVQHLGVAEHVWVLPEELDRFALPPADVKLARKLHQRGRLTLGG